MDYEKKYKEALETARKINSGEGVLAPSGWTRLEVVFPELHESKDERIRKDICTWLKYKLENCTYPTPKKETLSTWIDYLEKQKEQKPIEDVIKNITKNKEAAIKFLKSAGIMDDNGELAEMYRSEQKPAEWSEDIIQKAIKEVGLTQHQINWFKANVFPPKQEWSEEDEKHINLILRILDRQQCWDGATGKKFNPYQDEIDWLKSLRLSLLGNLAKRK